jgi:hypothetical protein
VDSGTAPAGSRTNPRRWHVNRHSVGSTVLLSDAEDAKALAADLALRSLPATCHATVAELLKDEQLSSVAVLVMRFPPLPKGMLLAHLGKLNLEYPWMQKLMVVEGTLPLPIAEYLTACGVDLVRCRRRDAADADHLATLVQRLQERSQWLTPRERSIWSPPAM